MLADLVFLLDVDNTLLDGDRVVADLHDHLERVFGADCAQRYWTIFDALREELGYVDYLGALQRYRKDIEQGSASEQRLLMMASFLIDYSFADRLHGCQESQLVVDHHIVPGRVMPLHRIEALLLVHVDQRTALYGVP